MDTIDLALWEPNPEDPRYLRYAGQPVAEDVFHELESRLNDSGMLPDEYFLMDSEWESGTLIPKDAGVFCTTDYGESEGIYVDVYLKWYEEGRPITRSFATGKTLGETGYDLDRMFLIASAITKAFSGYGFRNETAEGVILQLDNAERDALLDALANLDPSPTTESLRRKLVPELTRKDIRVDQDMQISDNGQTITSYLETWFDVDKKFGLRTGDDDSTWVNLYAEFTPAEDSLTMTYVVDGRDSVEEYEYTPTASEAEMVKELVTEKIRELYHQTPEEFLKSSAEEPKNEMGGASL